MLNLRLLFFCAALAAILTSTSGFQNQWAQQYVDQYDQEVDDQVPCTCGLFLESQTQLKGVALRTGEEDTPIFSYPIEETLDEEIPGGLKGRRICTRKCIELGMKHMQQGPQLLCAFTDRDIVEERIHLFVKNKEDKWFPTRMNSGRVFTCKDGQLL